MEDTPSMLPFAPRPFSAFLKTWIRALSLPSFVSFYARSSAEPRIDLATQVLELLCSTR